MAPSPDHIRLNRGELIGGRYEVVCEVGCGHFSKVYHCFDRELPVMQRKAHPVAAKILSRDYRTDAPFEIRMLKILGEKDPSNKARVSKLFNYFDWRDCPVLIMPIHGPSLRSRRLGTGRGVVTRDSLIEFSFDLLETLQYVHFECHMVHTDLKPENILLTDVNAPDNTIGDGWVICDFGSASLWRMDRLDSDLISTRPYRAPEVVLGHRWFYAADMWSVGCILYEVATGHRLFEVKDDNTHLQAMAKRVGKIPEALIKKSKFGSKFFNKRGEFTITSDYVRAGRVRLTPLREMFHGDPDFLHLLTSLLAYEPSKRLTASDALQFSIFDAVRERRRQQAVGCPCSPAPRTQETRVCVGETALAAHRGEEGDATGSPRACSLPSGGKKASGRRFKQKEESAALDCVDWKLSSAQELDSKGHPSSLSPCVTPTGTVSSPRQVNTPTPDEAIATTAHVQRKMVTRAKSVPASRTTTRKGASTTLRMARRHVVSKVCRLPICLGTIEQGHALDSEDFAGSSQMLMSPVHATAVTTGTEECHESMQPVELQQTSTEAREPMKLTCFSPPKKGPSGKLRHRRPEPKERGDGACGEASHSAHATHDGGSNTRCLPSETENSSTPSPPPVDATNPSPDEGPVRCLGCDGSTSDARVSSSQSKMKHTHNASAGETAHDLNADPCFSPRVGKKVNAPLLHKSSPPAPSAVLLEGERDKLDRSGGATHAGSLKYSGVSPRGLAEFASVPVSTASSHMFSSAGITCSIKGSVSHCRVDVDLHGRMSNGSLSDTSPRITDYVSPSRRRGTPTERLYHRSSSPMAQGTSRRSVDGQALLQSDNVDRNVSCADVCRHDACHATVHDPASREAAEPTQRFTETVEALSHNGGSRCKAFQSSPYDGKNADATNIPDTPSTKPAASYFVAKSTKVTQGTQFVIAHPRRTRSPATIPETPQSASAGVSCHTPGASTQAGIAGASLSTPTGRPIAPQGDRIASFPPQESQRSNGVDTCTTRRPSRFSVVRKETGDNADVSSFQYSNRSTLLQKEQAKGAWHAAPSTIPQLTALEMLKLTPRYRSSSLTSVSSREKSSVGYSTRSKSGVVARNASKSGEVLTPFSTGSSACQQAPGASGTTTTHRRVHREIATVTAQRSTDSLGGEIKNELGQPLDFSLLQLTGGQSGGNNAGGRHFTKRSPNTISCIQSTNTSAHTPHSKNSARLFSRTGSHDAKQLWQRPATPSMVGDSNGPRSIHVMIQPNSQCVTPRSLGDLSKYNCKSGRDTCSPHPLNRGRSPWERKRTLDDIAPTGALTQGVDGDRNVVNGGPEHTLHDGYHFATGRRDSRTLRRLAPVSRAGDSSVKPSRGKLLRWPPHAAEAGKPQM